MNKVCVYIPNLNCKPYIKDCLDSVINQTWDPMEILISDDGSTDGSLEICREYAKNDNRIELFERSKPSGSCGDINSTLAHVTAKFICKMDSDDIMMDHYWENIIHLFSRPEIGFVSIGMITMNEKGESTLVHQPPLFWVNPLDIFAHNAVYSASPFRLEMFKKIGGWDIGRPHPDWDFWIRCMLDNWKWAYCLKPMYYYRIRADSIVHSLEKTKTKEVMDYYKNKYKDIMDKLGLQPAPDDSISIGIPKHGQVNP